MVEIKESHHFPSTHISHSLFFLVLSFCDGVEVMCFYPRTQHNKLQPLQPTAALSLLPFHPSLTHVSALLHPCQHPFTQLPLKLHKGRRCTSSLCFPCVCCYCTEKPLISTRGLIELCGQYQLFSDLSYRYSSGWHILSCFIAWGKKKWVR